MCARPSSGTWRIWKTSTSPCNGLRRTSQASRWKRLSAALAWRIELHPWAEKELSKLDRERARPILRFLRERVAALQDPRSLGETGRGPEVGRFWKYPLGDCRLICDIQKQRVTILGVRVGHRRDVYR